MPSLYLNQCWNIVNWTPRNKLQWNFNRSSNIFIQENALDDVVCETVSTLSRPQCVKTISNSLNIDFIHGDIHEKNIFSGRLILRVNMLYLDCYDKRVYWNMPYICSTHEFCRCMNLNILAVNIIYFISFRYFLFGWQDHLYTDMNKPVTMMTSSNGNISA